MPAFLCQKRKSDKIGSYAENPIKSRRLSFIEMKKILLFVTASLLLVSCGKSSSSKETKEQSAEEEHVQELAQTLIEGCLSGEFSVSAVKKVHFSKGNLQYYPGGAQWRFAENQYDVIGNSNSEIADNYEGWIDLFGWATAGTVNGDTTKTAWRVACYKPTETEAVPAAWGNGLYGPAGSDGNYQTDLTGEFYTFDWGHNAIKNGGKQEGLWRTLTYKEWKYLLLSRPRAMQLLALGDIAGVKGLFIFPDGYDPSDNFQTLGEDDYIVAEEFPVEGYYNRYGDYSGWNSVKMSEWNYYQQQGVVFLPAAGVRYGKSTTSLNDSGNYWSAAHSEFANGDSGKSNYATNVRFDGQRVLMNKQEERAHGLAVRLVCDIKE